MSELYDKSLLKLELDQVLELLAQCAGSEGGKEACLRLRPTSDLEGKQLFGITQADISHSFQHRRCYRHTDAPGFRAAAVPAFQLA